MEMEASQQEGNQVVIDLFENSIIQYVDTKVDKEIVKMARRKISKYSLCCCVLYLDIYYQMTL
jgi:hypothetical protein